jgi:choline transport protein
MKRVRHEKIHFGPWTLGRWGLPINLFAAGYTLLTVVFTFFPPSVPVTKESMNYSCVVFGGVVLAGLAYYVFGGRKRYVKPNLDTLLDG